MVNDSQSSYGNGDCRKRITALETHISDLRVTIGMQNKVIKMLEKS